MINTQFVGAKVLAMLALSLVIGVSLFFIDLYFSIAFQLYLSSMGLLTMKGLEIPSLLTVGMEHPFLLFAVVGVLRLVLISMKSLVSSLSNQNFVYLQRKRLVKLSFLNPERSLASHEVMAIFSERIVRAGGTISDLSSLLVVFTSVGFMMGWGLLNVWKELVLGLAICGVSLIPVMLMSRKIKGLGHEVDTVWLRLNKLISEGLKHFFFLFYHGNVHAQVQKAEELLTRSLKAYEKFFLVSSLNNIVPQIVGLVSITLITSVSIKYWHTNPALLLSFLYIYIRIAQGAGEAFYLISCLRLNISNYKFIRDLSLKGLAFEATKEKTDAPSVSFKKISDIKLEGIHFSFPQATKEVISGMNLHLSRGVPLIIKGPSGAGKSTLLSIILGYNCPTKGQIFFDQEKKDLSALTAVNRREISYVGPDPFLFDDTVLDNLTFGLEEKVDEKEILALLKEFGLLSIIEGRPQGLQERLGEHSALSTGQRQRLSLIRALLRKPEVLVLDEATSNLDVESETIIVNYISNYAKKTFVVIVTHRETFNSLNGMEIRL